MVKISEDWPEIECWVKIYDEDGYITSMQIEAKSGEVIKILKRLRRKKVAEFEKNRPNPIQELIDDGITPRDLYPDQWWLS